MVKQFDAPGLKKKKNKDGSFRYYWEARSDLAKIGYRPVTVRLHYDDAEQRAGRCRILQAEMLAWMSNSRQFPRRAYDGTIGSLCDRFGSDEDSPYKSVKWNSQKLYDQYVKIIKATVGARAIRELVGPDFNRWYRNWGAPAKPAGKPRPYRGKHAINTLRRVISYGVTCGYSDCARADHILSKMRFSSPAPRNVIMTPENVLDIRKAAHERGLASVAIATAFQFDLAIRQKDIIGEWIPIEDGETGGITFRGRRWSGGLLWSDIGPDLLLRKTHVKTGFEVEYDLRLAPNLLAEIDLVPTERRIGPLIVSEVTGEPYKHGKFSEAFRKVANHAGIPPEVWSMDARAGAVSEAYAGGASTTDVQKHAGHTTPQMSARYNRSSLDQTRRAMSARIQKRTKNKP